MRRRRHFLAVLLVAAYSLLPSASGAFDLIRSSSVPTLAVLADGRTGVVSYVVIQISPKPPQDGPTIQFNEINLGGGSAVGSEWKEGVKQAVSAALGVLGLDGRDWVVTVKHRSYNSVTEGSSASGAVAVGILSAWRGDTLRPDVVMTGRIEPDGAIKPVGGLPAKVQAAADERFTTVLVPRGQLATPQWDLRALAAARAIDVAEVGTLDDAYRIMTTGGR